MQEHKVLYRDKATGQLKVRNAELSELKYIAFTPQELRVVYDALARTLIDLRGSHEYKHYLRLAMARCREA